MADVFITKLNKNSYLMQVFFILVFMHFTWNLTLVVAGLFMIFIDVFNLYQDFIIYIELDAKNIQYWYFTVEFVLNLITNILFLLYILTFIDQLMVVAISYFSQVCILLLFSCFTKKQTSLNIYDFFSFAIRILFGIQVLFFAFYLDGYHYTRLSQLFRPLEILLAVQGLLFCIFCLSLLFSIYLKLRPSPNRKARKSYIVKSNIWFLLVIFGGIFNFYQIRSVLLTYYGERSGQLTTSQGYMNAAYLALYADTFYMLVLILAFSFFDSSLIKLFRLTVFKDAPETQLSENQIKKLQSQIEIMTRRVYQNYRNAQLGRQKDQIKHKILREIKDPQQVPKYVQSFSQTFFRVLNADQIQVDQQSKNQNLNQIISSGTFGQPQSTILQAQELQNLGRATRQESQVLGNQLSYERQQPGETPRSSMSHHRVDSAAGFQPKFNHTQAPTNFNFETVVSERDQNNTKEDIDQKKPTSKIVKSMQQRSKKRINLSNSSELVKNPEAEQGKTQTLPAEDLNQPQICIICMESPSDAVYYDCGHGGICFNCSIEVLRKGGACHLCRQSITSILRLDLENKKDGFYPVIKKFNLEEREIDP